MKKLLYITLAVSLACVNTIKPIEFGRLFSGAQSAIDDSKAIDTALTQAQASLNTAKQAMAEKRGTTKERGQVAVDALFKGFSAVLLIVAAINKLNDALVEGDVPGLSAKLKDTVKPRLAEAKATGLEVQKALNYLQDLIKPSAVATVAAVTKPALPLVPQVVPTKSTVPVTTDDLTTIPAPRGRNGAVIAPSNFVPRTMPTSGRSLQNFAQ